MQFTVTTKRTYDVVWMKRDFMSFSEKYERIRDRFKRKLTSCFKCRRKFKYGEVMALGHLKGAGNRVFCQYCAKEIEGE